MCARGGDGPLCCTETYLAQNQAEVDSLQREVPFAQHVYPVGQDRARGAVVLVDVEWDMAYRHDITIAPSTKEPLLLMFLHVSFLPPPLQQRSLQRTSLQRSLQRSLRHQHHPHHLTLNPHLSPHSHPLHSVLLRRSPKQRHIHPQPHAARSVRSRLKHQHPNQFPPHRPLFLQ